MLGRRKESAESAPAAEAGAARPITPTQVKSGAPQPQVHKRLGDLLVEENLLAPDQLQEALAIQEKQGGFLGQILVSQGFITQEAVASCLVKQCKIPHLSLLDYDIGSDVLSLIPEAVCRKHNLLPIDKLGRILTVAMVDPLDIDALEEVRAACPELRIKPILCNWEHFELVANKVFSGKDKAGGSGEVTAQSLGLRMAPAREKAPAEKPAPAATEVSPAPAVHAPAESLNADALMRAMRESMRETIQEFIAAQQPHAPTDLAAFTESIKESMSELAHSLQAPATGATAPTPQDFAAVMRETVSALSQEIKQRDQAHENLAESIRDSVGGAMQEALAAVVVQLRAESRQRDQQAGPSTEELAALMQASVREAVSGVAAELREAKSEASAAGGGFSAEALAESIRDSVGGAMQEALASVLLQMRADAMQGAEKSAAGPETPSLEGFADALRDSVGGAVQEAMAEMVVQLRAMAGKKEGEVNPEAVAQIVRDAQGELLHSVQQTLEATQMAQAQQENRLAQIAEAVLQSVQKSSQLVENATVQAGVQHDLQQRRRKQHASVSPFGAPRHEVADAKEADAAVLDALDSETPQEGFTFENFLPGKTNAFTHKLSQAVAANPGQEYNPFFLYGHVGTGKTHLINAIGNAILAQAPDAHRIGYVSASHFARCLKEAIADNALDAFRENYCHWEVLILDDIQFMGGKVEAQEEFFHIFNVLHQQARQIIIASDKPPDRLGLLEERLVSRFSSGIVAELKAPEWETRMGILRQVVAECGVEVPEEILALLAMRVPNDVRKMMGALRKIIAFANLVGQEMSCELADEILSHLGVEEAA